MFLHLSNMAFACVYVLAQNVALAVPKIGKKEQKLDFDYFGIISIDK